MKAQSWIFLIAFFFAMAMSGFSQRAENWRVYKAADGLPQTFVSSIGNSARGNVWVRHPGLEWIGRLDGYEIQAIPAPDMSDSRIYESASGQIWTFSNGSLFQYKKDSGWIKYTAPEITSELVKNRLSPAYVVTLCPLKQNHVLLLFPDGLTECNIEKPDHPQTTLFRAANKTGLQIFSAMTPAADGGLWIAGKNGLMKSAGLFRNLKPDAEWQEFLFSSEIKIKKIRQLVDDNAGGAMLLAESEDGRQLLVHFDGLRWDVKPVNGQKLSQAWRETDQTYWATTPNTLLQMKKGEDQFAPYEEISPHRFFDFSMETNGTFWLATSDGLFRYAPLAWRSPKGIVEPNSAILSMAEDSSGNFWMASPKSVQLFQNDKWIDYPLPRELTGNNPENHALFALTNGTIVLEIDERLFRFNPSTQQFSAVGGVEKLRKSLGLLKNGYLCVQTLTAGKPGGSLEMFDGVNFQPFPFAQPELVSSNEFQFLLVSQNDSIWVGFNEGLASYNNNKWEIFHPPTHNPLAASARMIEISENKFWIGMEGKIMEFDGKNWNSVRSGFDNINALIKSRDGSIWVASDNGVHRFFRGAWVANNAEEGLPAAAIHQIYEDRRGRIWAGTAHGLAQYHPEADQDPPRTYIENLPGPNNSTPENVVITINFSGRDKWKYTPEESLLYSYRLDGQEWSPYQEQRSVTLIDLPAGEHSFRVRSMDRNWNIDSQPALLRFKITLPWYRESGLILSSSAGLAIALFFAGLAFNRHRQLVRSYAEVEAKVALRTRQLELANQELFHSQKMNALGTLAAGIAHDFNNILSIIKGSAQIIEDNLDNQNKVRTRADRIKTVVEQGAGIVKAMLGFSRGSDRNLALCDVNSIVRETITLLGDRFLREVEVLFHSATNPLPEVPVSKDFLQQILLNFIFNAAEATTGRQKIILKVIQSGQLPSSLALKPGVGKSYVFVSVQDFGSGIAPEIMSRIFEPFFTTKSLSARRGTGLGLSMVYELARQMDCGLNVESTVGKGSTFTLIIPERDLPVESSPKHS